MKTLLLEKPSAKKEKKNYQPTKLLLSTSVYKTTFREKTQLTSSSSSSSTLLPSRKFCRTNANARQEILETHQKKREFHHNQTKRQSFPKDVNLLLKPKTKRGLSLCTSEK
jgi:hypothetical protein